MSLPTELIKFSPGNSCRGRNGWFTPNSAEICYRKREQDGQTTGYINIAIRSLHGERIGGQPACVLELVPNDAIKLAYAMLHHAGVLGNRPVLQKELNNLADILDQAAKAENENEF